MDGGVLLTPAPAWRRSGLGCSHYANRGDLGMLFLRTFRRAAFLATSWNPAGVSTV
jgi:hypothetical protein